MSSIYKGAQPRKLKLKGGIRPVFDHCVNAMAAATILSFMYGGWGELLYLQINSAQITVATYFSCDKINAWVILVNAKKYDTPQEILPFPNTSAPPPPPRLHLPVPHVSTKPLKSSLSLHAEILF